MALCHEFLKLKLSKLNMFYSLNKHETNSIFQKGYIFTFLVEFIEVKH